MGTTVKLEGRKNEPLVIVKTARFTTGSSLSFELMGAALRTQQGRGVDRWSVLARHDDGTDFEHDSAAVAELSGVALKFESMDYGLSHFSAVLMKGSWYPSGTEFKPGMEFAHCRDNAVVNVCTDTDLYHPPESGWPSGHLLMPFRPPERTFMPMEVEIIVDHNRFIPEV